MIFVKSYFMNSEIIPLSYTKKYFLTTIFDRIVDKYFMAVFCLETDMKYCPSIAGAMASWIIQKKHLIY